MNLIFSLTVATLFATGIHLMLKRDLIRVAVGLTLVSNAINLFIMTAGLFRGGAPIYPFDLEGIIDGDIISDPLVQALVLTAIVISFGTSTLVIALIYRIFTTHQSLDQESLRQAEEDEIIEQKREQEREQEAI